jgi:hypothetical protein
MKIIPPKRPGNCSIPSSRENRKVYDEEKNTAQA